MSEPTVDGTALEPAARTSRSPSAVAAAPRSGLAPGVAAGRTTGPAGTPDDGDLSSYPRRWAALAVIAVTQLMLMIDMSIMNIALPSAARDLGVTDANRQWAVTAYTLAFGGLLLLGGRVADYLGRRRMLLVGLIGFAGASALGGAAWNAGSLFGARALQGACAALLAPAALSLVTVMFRESHERARAFGVFGAISGAGGAIGLLAGGALTEYLDWRWCLFVNVPIAVVAGVAALRIVPESRAHGRTRLDVPGAILATGGLVALVYAFTEAAKQTTDPQGRLSTVGWTDPLVLTLLGVAALALVAFVVLERRVRNPLLPLRVVLDRNRGGSYLVFLLVGAGLFSMFLFLTLYFQVVLGWTPLRAGFAFLPFAGTIIVAAGLVARILPRTGPRPLMLLGLTLGTVGMLLMIRTTPDAQYVTRILPAEIVIAAGMACVFVPTSSTALIGVQQHDAGVASALLNTAQQVGGSLGLALLNTMAVAAVTTRLTDLVADGADPTSLAVQQAAVVHGYHVAYAWGAGLLALGLVVALVLVRANRETMRQGALLPQPA